MSASVNKDSRTLNLFQDIAVQESIPMVEHEKADQKPEENPNKISFAEEYLTDNDQSAPELQLTDNAIKVLEKRYLLKNEEGNVSETAEQMFQRIAHFVASADKLYDKNADVESTEKNSMT